MDGLKCLKKGRPPKVGVPTDIMPKKKIKPTFLIIGILHP